MTRVESSASFLLSTNSGQAAKSQLVEVHDTPGRLLEQLFHVLLLYGVTVAAFQNAVNGNVDRQLSG
jgi:hypothetical protein